MTQNELILDWLKSGRTLTALQALTYFNCFRLAARCWELKEEGHPIKKEWITTAMSNKKIIRYSYEKGNE